MSLSLRVALFASVVAIVAVGVVSRLEYLYDIDSFWMDTGDHITDVAAVAAAGIPGDLHEEVVSVFGG